MRKTEVLAEQVKNRRLAAKPCSCKRDIRGVLGCSVNVFSHVFLQFRQSLRGVSVRSLEWSTSEFGDFLEELGDFSWSPPQGMVMFGCLAPWVSLTR